MIKWELELVRLDSLSQYDKNPRSLSEKEHRNLSDSIDKFGLIDRPVLNSDNTIIGGHQRIEVLLSKGVAETECWVPNRMLNDQEIEELNIRLNRNNGSWDYDILANSFDVGDLLSWGFEEDELGLGEKEKPKKKEKFVISFEFEEKDTMLDYIGRCEELAAESDAKMKIKG